MKEKKLDRRRKYYLVLDCETATLPCIADYPEQMRQKLSIAKPLIYDLGWTITDKNGKVYRKKNFLINEIFCTPKVFNTAYYKSKRPKYIEAINNGEIKVVSWFEAIAELEADMKEVEAVGAYNAMFDFKKAIPFTQLYISELYSNDFESWLELQKEVCNDIANGERKEKEKTFDPDTFLFKGKKYPLFDIWGLACKYLLNNDEYKGFCELEGFVSASGQYYKTSAEVCYRYLKNDADFIEAHTALDDAEIETEILFEIFKATKGKLQIGIIHFPFRILGKVK